MTKRLVETLGGHEEGPAVPTRMNAGGPKGRIE